MGVLASVADAERAAIAAALRHNEDKEDILILSDSQAAIQSVMTLSTGSPTRSGIERSLITSMQKRTQEGKKSRIAWVRGHIDIIGNELEDRQAAAATEREGRNVITANASCAEQGKNKMGTT